MDQEYLLYGGAILFGASALALFIYLSYRRGSVFRIGKVITFTAVLVDVICFVMAKEEINLLPIIIALATVVPIMTGLISWAMKTIVATAMTIQKAST